MADVTIEEITTDDPRLRELLAVHKAYSLAHTPGGGGHALSADADLSGLRYWLALDHHRALGCVGLQPIVIEGATQGEVKSMHVLAEARGRGIGTKLLDCLVAVAQQSGWRHLYLETHLGEGFAASRALYTRSGFIACDRFGPYADDPASFCMRYNL